LFSKHLANSSKMPCFSIISKVRSTINTPVFLAYKTIFRVKNKSFFFISFWCLLKTPLLTFCLIIASYIKF
jgi:hypothetical protein